MEKEKQNNEIMDELLTKILAWVGGILSIILTIKAIFF